MGSEAAAPRLHILFAPMMAQGHMIPAAHMAILFARRGVRSTILTTPGNARTLQPVVDRAVSSGLDLALHLVPFPFHAPVENMSLIPDKDAQADFLVNLRLFRQPFERALRELSPDVLVSDMFFPWTAELAAEFGIPRLVFEGTNLFSHCCRESIHVHKPHEKNEAAESFVLPGLPHKIELLKSQIPAKEVIKPELLQLLEELREAELRSFGLVVNSFRELEPEYVEHYKEALGRKAWLIGPVSLCNKDTTDMSLTRGTNTNTGNDHYCLDWLNSKEPDSVIYICFGSMSAMCKPQLREIALGLAASGHPFLWVIRDDADDPSEWLPEETDAMIRNGEGLIFRGWAPQVLILNHGSVGGFMTHCGWNSCLEGITAGKPMATWPLFAEQFSNEKLIVDLLRVGVAVGSKKYMSRVEEEAWVRREQISGAVSRVMGGGDESGRIKDRAKELGEVARKAVEEGGSSYEDMGRLIEELVAVKRNNGVDLHKAKSLNVIF